MESLLRRRVEALRLHCGNWFHEMIDQISAMRAMQALDCLVISWSNGIASLELLVGSLAAGPEAASSPTQRIARCFCCFQIPLSLPVAVF
jgi:hypothetical protein